MSEIFRAISASLIPKSRDKDLRSQWLDCLDIRSRSAELIGNLELASDAMRGHGTRMQVSFSGTKEWIWKKFLRVLKHHYNAWLLFVAVVQRRIHGFASTHWLPRDQASQAPGPLNITPHLQYDVYGTATSDFCSLHIQGRQ